MPNPIDLQEAMRGGSRRPSGGPGNLANTTAGEPPVSLQIGELRDAGIPLGGVGSGGDGSSPFDVLQAILTGAGGSGGGRGAGGGRRSGGGGGGGGVPAGMADAYRAYLGSLGPTDLSGRFDGIRDRLLGMTPDTGAVFDDQLASIGRGADAARDRVAGIGAQVADRADQARQRIAELMNQNAGALRRTGSVASERQAVGNAGINDVLQRFDAGGVEADTASIDNLRNAAQLTNQNLAGLFDQSLSDRASIGSDLASDASLGLTQQEQALTAQVAAQRAAQERAQLEAQRQLEAELFMEQMRAEEARRQQEAQIRLEAARLGIQV